MNNNIGFIGGGKMAEAIISAVVAKKIFSAGSIFVSDVSAARRRILKIRYGVNVVSDNSSVLKMAETVIIAVKPQDIETALSGLSMHAGKRHLMISIAAGKKLSSLQKLMPSARFARVMPNMACQVGEGMSVFCLGEKTKRSDRQIVKKLFEAVGAAKELPEKFFDAVTALSGSGPAFIAYAIDSLVDGAVAAGLGRGDALALAKQTLAGTALVLKERGISPDELVRSVASPGGTTNAGLKFLEENNTRSILANAVISAAKRSRELGS